MSDSGAAKRVIIKRDADTLAEYVATRFVNRIVKRVDEGKRMHICLTGGTMGGAVLRAAARDERVSDIDWSLVHFWFGDERFVPRDSDDRNEKQAREAFLDHLDVPAENIHTVASSDDGVDLDAAAIAYADELAQFAPSDRNESGPWPSFDICFLGVGPDAHIASLFPDRPEISVTDRATVPVRESPKPPSDRVSLTRPVINSSKRVWMVIAGADKAAALGLALAGASYQSVPAAGAKGRRRTAFFVDEVAADQVPPQLIDREY
ncbi:MULTISPECIES: 6-phosphogluconolactonase [Microbacterium]|uniref:6-phosphogluconolactonase n=1 Tax=Microbacterium TaxID=33882 RepID=UPI0027813C40|nr:MULTISPECIES: 6-phosphogluconolactonase [Microbacterium]MDQ1084398.1 6-phosphogluconolactonase [Microbacterium sp. SORGH_AS_0344]MDQ1170328.1 6-phosphogluconolactonase [Microbacterium proteolyticum]